MADSLYEALLDIQTEGVNLRKDSQNPHFKNTYASLGAVLGALKPHLDKQGLLVTQAPSNLLTGPAATPALVTTVVHLGSGDVMESVTPLILDKDNMQGLGSAITYARRYALVSIFGLDADEDDDGNAASKVKAEESGGKVF